MNIPKLCLLLLNTDQLLIQNLTMDQSEIRLDVESTTQKASCPECVQESTAIHSHYLRYPVDLAWAQWSVVIQLKVKRFFCRNQACPKRTFAERFPDFVACYARQTLRVVEKQHRIGVNVAARIAEQLLGCEQVGISDTTINRQIRSLPEAETHPVRILGVDDWAKRKGQRYGTLLADLERGETVDVLPDRTADTLTEWLKAHPGIEIVSRDRSQTYAEAIDRGAPQAIQVADRWHLLKNVSDAVFKILQQEYPVIQRQLELGTEAIKLIRLQEGEPTNKARALTLAEQRRKERIEQAQQSHRQGWTQKAIAHQLHIHPKTVRRYLHSSFHQGQRQRTGRLIDPFKSYILQRWNEGCHNATQLFREIQPKGFAGTATTVRIHVRQLRQVSDLPPKARKQTGTPLEVDPTQHPTTLRNLTWWVLKKPEDRAEDEEKILSQISTGQPKLLETVQLARSFAEIVRQKQADQFDGWLEQARKSGYRIWRNFADSLKQDESAVRAALLYSWSNGPTEGHINRLKCLKRLMYGRAKDDLLRKRVLWQGKRSFT